MEPRFDDYTTEFLRFHRENPDVYTELVDLARTLKARGHRFYGINMIRIPKRKKAEPKRRIFLFCNNTPADFIDDQIAHGTKPEHIGGIASNATRLADLQDVKRRWPHIKIFWVVNVGYYHRDGNGFIRRYRDDQKKSLPARLAERVREAKSLKWPMLDGVNYTRVKDEPSEWWERHAPEEDARDGEAGD